MLAHVRFISDCLAALVPQRVASCRLLRRALVITADGEPLPKSTHALFAELIPYYGFLPDNFQVF